HEIFFQVFDKGWMEDGEGRMIDFKNTIILLTSNAGSELIMNMCKDPELLPDPESLATAMTEPLQKIFPPALLGRIVTIPYYPLSDEMLGQIVKLQLNRIKKRVAENHKIPFEFRVEVVGALNFLGTAPKEVDLHDLLGTRANITMDVQDIKRHFNSYIVGAERGERVGRYERFTLVMRPWLWFLTKTKNYRVFQ